MWQEVREKLNYWQMYYEQKVIPFEQKEAVMSERSSPGG